MQRKEDLREIPGLKPWDIPILKPEELTMLVSSERARYFAQFGNLAPTTHNTSPQKFEIKEDSLEILLDREFVLMASDRDGRQATISIGCVIETVNQAAQAYGIQPKVEILEKEKQKTLPLKPGEANRLVPMAKINFGENKITHVDYETLEAIKGRRVNRAEYDERVKIPNTLTQKIINATGELGVNLRFITARLLMQQVGNFQERADYAVVQMNDFREELTKWLYPNSSVSQKRGMRGSEFGLSDEASERFVKGLKGEIRLLPDELAGFARAGKIGINSAPALCIITTPNDLVTSRINAGRAFLRSCLFLQKEGFSAAVHAALTEKGMVRIKPFNLMLKAALRTSDDIMMVFRLGVPRREEDKNRPHSLRPNFEELVV